jgi:hypothetical protein
VFGVVVILITLFVAIPVGVLMSGGAFAAVLGTLLPDHADEAAEGTELVELDRKQFEIYAR